MLKQKFDYTIAYFDSLSDVDPDQFKTADIATVVGYHPDGIYHSVSMRWKCFLHNKTISELIRSNKERQNLEKNREYFLNQGFTFEIKEMSEQDFYEFETLYDNTTQKKERAIRYTLKDKILGRILVQAPVYCAGMYLKEKLVSGLVFTITQDKELLVSFGAKQKFKEVRGGVGGTLEWELLKFAQAQKVSVIDHGRNPNPMGLTSKSGLFEFKARYGNSAYPEGHWVTTFIRNPKIVLSDLVFVNTINDTVGYTIVTGDYENTNQKKYLTHEISNIRVLSLDEVVNKAKNAF